MKLKQYIKEASRTNAPLDNNYDDMTSIHMILGMVTEVAELADVYKKHLAYKKFKDMVNIKEELGDLMWYIAGFCKMNNINIHEVLQTNINKLKARYPDKFTEEAAIIRDLDNERKILEK